MKKKEWVYRELLTRTMASPTENVTQLSLAKSLSISLSTVNNAIKPLGKMGAIELKNFGFRVTDAEKALAYWGSIRDLQKDIIYKTRAELPVVGIEKSMPSGVKYTAYSAFKFRYGDVPADYGEVYVYASSPEELRDRFPERKGPANLIALKMDRRLAELSEGGVAPAPQVYVDLWNLREWYAKEFLKALEGRFGW